MILSYCREWSLLTQSLTRLTSLSLNASTISPQNKELGRLSQYQATYIGVFLVASIHVRKNYGTAGCLLPHCIQVNTPVIPWPAGPWGPWGRMLPLQNPLLCIFPVVQLAGLSSATAHHVMQTNFADSGNFLEARLTSLPPSYEAGF